MIEDPKKKTEGWRKMGIGLGAITALSINPTIDFKIAVIMGVIAIVGIVCQGILDYEKKKIQPPD